MCIPGCNSEDRQRQQSNTNQLSSSSTVIANCPPPRNIDWGSGSTSRGNCYRYACDAPAGLGESHSPFPGGVDPGRHITCADIMDGARRDGAVNPNPNGTCPVGHRKIAGVIQDASDRGPGNDFHWYRQNPNGRWTHKRGAHAEESTDASGNVILDPATANRHYPGSSDYDGFCGYLCAPVNMNIH